MPHFFKYSLNGRRDQNTNKKYAEPNNSAMNRICKVFDDIGKINMNFAGIGQFNWQMLLEAPCTTSRPEIPELFCKLDDCNVSNEIMSQDQNYLSERQLTDGIQMTSEDIVRIFNEKFGSLEEAYPYVVKYLFGGEGMNRSAHKQMFWKVFGEIALRNIKNNLLTCDTCPNCKMRIPSWVKKHTCTKSSQGFYECIDCGTICNRTNGRQCRCQSCQEEYGLLQKRIRMKSSREKSREIEHERIMRLGSSLKTT